MTYSVGTLREAGLEARWGKTRGGAPILLARDLKGETAHARKTWYAVDQRMYAMMLTQGVLEGFRSATLLGEYFSIPV